MDKRYMNQSILRALEIMELFGQKGTSLGLKEISEATGLHKSTAHRLLWTLESRGWAARDALSGKYRPGIRMLTIARWVDEEGINSVKEVRPILNRLAETCRELILLSMWDGEDVICVDKVDASREQTLKVTSSVGQKHPLHTGATGFSVLMAMSEEEALGNLQGKELRAYTERTKTRLEQVMDAYRRMQDWGYVFSSGNVDPGVAGIGMPLWFPYEKTCGSIGVMIPESRASEPELKRLLACLQEAVGQIHELLGVKPPKPSLPGEYGIAPTL